MTTTYGSPALWGTLLSWGTDITAPVYPVQVGDLSLTCRISTAPGVYGSPVAGAWNYSTWLDLNSGAYELEKDAFSETRVTHTKVEAKSPFFEGSFTAFSKRENLNADLNVYVRGSSPLDVSNAIDALTNACDQPNFAIEWQDDNDHFFWDCTASDYSISVAKELRHARMAIVKISLVRLPGVRRP